MNQMDECQVKRPFKRNGVKTLEWIDVPVSSLGSTPAQGGIRCKHCQGAVRVHKQRVPNGPADHVEHLMRQDSENSRGGVHFKGTHRRSAHPVE